MYILGSCEVTNLMANGSLIYGVNSTVEISWSEPCTAPSYGYQIVSPSVILYDHVWGTSYVMTITQPGNYTVEVLPLTQHFPYKPATVQVIVGKKLYKHRKLMTAAKIQYND